MAYAPDFADLEILIRQRRDTGYPVKLVLNSVQTLADGLLGPACLPQNFSFDAPAAGEQLFRYLLADASLRNAWYTASGAPELHALPRFTGPRRTGPSLQRYLAQQSQQPSSPRSGNSAPL